MNKFIVAALVIVNALVIAGIARADQTRPAELPGTVQICTVDARGDLVCGDAKPLESTPKHGTHGTVQGK